MNPRQYADELESTWDDETIEAMLGVKAEDCWLWNDAEWCSFLNCTIEELPDKLQLPDDVPPPGYVNFYDELSDEMMFVTAEQEAILEELWDEIETSGNDDDDDFDFDGVFDPYQMALDDALPASRSSMFTSTPAVASLSRGSVVPFQRPAYKPMAHGRSYGFPKQQPVKVIKHHFEIVR